jgi:hypothetical protein
MDGRPTIEQAQVTQSPSSPPTNSVADLPMMINGVPLEIINHFDVDVRAMDNRTQGRLQDIVKFLPGEKLGDKLISLRDVERKLGAPAHGETRYGRVWNWLKVTSRIDDLVKQREAIVQ